MQRFCQGVSTHVCPLDRLSRQCYRIYMPFQFRLCFACRHQRICREVPAESEPEVFAYPDFRSANFPPREPNVLTAWICECCDESGDVAQWPALPSEAHDD